MARDRLDIARRANTYIIYMDIFMMFGGLGFLLLLVPPLLGVRIWALRVGGGFGKATLIPTLIRHIQKHMFVRLHRRWGVGRRSGPTMVTRTGVLAPHMCL